MKKDQGRAKLPFADHDALKGGAWSSGGAGAGCGHACVCVCVCSSKYV